MKYVRVKDDKLYTPIVQHRKGDLIVTNIGAVHIGELDYYERLQEELDRIPEGFFEQVKPPTDKGSVPPEKRQYVQGIQNLTERYERFAHYLGFVTQHVLDYPDSWQNPDMALDEFIRIAPTELLRKLSGSMESLEAFEKLHQSSPESLSALIKGTMKYMCKVSWLTKSASFLTKGPAYNKIILKERNKRLFAALKPKLESPDHSELGIIYGAAHLKGIDRFLRSNGFKREGELWIPAWDLESDLSFWQALKILCR